MCSRADPRESGNLWVWSTFGHGYYSRDNGGSLARQTSVSLPALPMATCSGLSPVGPVSHRKAKRWW